MSNVDGLASEWLEVKAQEKEIIAKRHAIEEQITKALDAKGEGSISHKTGTTQSHADTACVTQG